MNCEDLSVLVKYHAAANELILSTTAKLTEEEFRRPAPLDHGSVFATLRHLVDTDWSWREVLAGNEIGETYVWDHGFALNDLQSIHSFCREEDARLRDFVGGLDESTLAVPAALRKDLGPMWVVLVHIVIHGTQHRSELARYLTDCGHSPGDMDLLDAVALA